MGDEMTKEMAERIEHMTEHSAEIAKKDIIQDLKNANIVVSDEIAEEIENHILEVLRAHLVTAQIMILLSIPSKTKEEE